MTITFLFVWLLTLLAPPAQTDGLTLDARAGFDGFYEVSAAVPIVVTARNDGAPIEGEVRVVLPGGATGAPLIYSAPVSLPTGSDKRIPLVVHLPTFGDTLLVQLFNDGQIVAEMETDPLRGVNRDELFYGVVSSDPGGLAFLETVPGTRRDAAVAFLDLDDLPEVSSAWNGLDVLVLDDVDTSRLTAGQLAALQAWLESGGHLVVAGGPGGPRTAAGVADLLPVAVTGVTSVEDLPALAEFAGLPLDAPGPYAITAADLVRGEPVIEQDGQPLLARAPVGRGAVTFLALDPRGAPLAGWAGGDQFWAEMAAAVPVLPPWAGGIRDGYAATQAVASIPGMRLPSVLQLILFLLLYTVIIGPINFLVLRRLKRRELAWITIPALVLLFSLATFLTGFRSRGNLATLNQMTIAFGSADADRLRTQTAIGLYSPRRARHDLALPYDATVFPFGESFGAIMGEGNFDVVERAAGLTLRGVRTDTGAVATFIVESHQPRPAVTATATLSSEQDVIEVSVRNESGVTLEDAVVIYGQEQAAVGDVAPGGERVVQVSLRGTQPATVPTPDPLFAPTFTYPNPLINDPSLILGTTEYFNDPVAYPRWQLIQTTYSDEALNPASLPDPTQIVTLGGWLAEPALAANVVAEEATRIGSTLLLLEIPVR